MSVDALAVIDMQPRHCRAAADEQTVQAVLSQIELAMASDFWILLVELTKQVFGETDSRITKLLDGYAKLQRLEKAGSSGAGDIMLAAQVLEFSRLRVVGVNTNSCVKITVDDLVRYRGLHPIVRIDVVKDACNTEFGPRDCWDDFPCHPIIHLV